MTVLKHSELLEKEIRRFKLYFVLATVSYRLLPEISLLKDVEGEKAQRLKSSFSPGVIELVKEKGRNYFIFILRNLK